jgi:hypothetical protein
VNGEHTPELTSPELSYDLRRLIRVDRNSDLIAAGAGTNGGHSLNGLSCVSNGNNPYSSSSVGALVQLPLDELLSDDLLDGDKFEQLSNGFGGLNSLNSHLNSLNAMNPLSGLNTLQGLSGLHVPPSESPGNMSNLDSCVQLNGAFGCGLGAFVNDRSSRETYQLQRLTIKSEPDDPLEMNSCSPHSSALYSPATLPNTPFANYSPDRSSLKFGHLLANGKALLCLQSAPFPAIYTVSDF